MDDGFYGIYLANSRNNVLRNNSVIGHKPTPTFTYGQNFAVVGDVLEDFINDVDTSNTVNEKPVYYWVNRQNAAVPPNAGAVVLVNCTNITVQNQHLMQNKYGVLLAWTSGSTVRGNTMEYDAVGIFLFHSWGNTIAENSVFESHGSEDNESHGIRIQSSYNNVISGNNVVSSMGAGICVSQSPGTRLLENRVQNNSNTGILIINHSDLFVVFRNYLAGNAGVTLRVADSAGGAIVGNNIENRYYAVYLTGVLQGTSVYGNDFDSRGHDLLMAYVSATGANPAWDNGTMGNYWSDYLTLYPNASEIETSGIGDAPYIISESNIDHYPLMAPLDASIVSMPEIESAPLPTPTPYQPPPTPTPTEASPTDTPEPSPTTTPLPTEQPIATPNQSSNPSPSQSPPPTEQPTSSTEQSPEIQDAVITAEVAYAVAGISVAIVIGAAVAVFLKKRK